LTFRPNDFEFGGIYKFVIVPSASLSKPKKYFQVLYKMPLDPGNKQASKWYASFLTITKHEVEHSLHVSFVGAPPGFCFEEYILALGKGDSEHRVVIPTEKMKPKVIRNKTYLIGEHTFSNLKLFSRLALFGAAVVVLLLFGLVYFMFVKFYRQYHHRKIIIHFGLSSNTPNDKMSSFLAGTPLIPKDHTNVLILYSHDSQPHDDAVLELASLLQETLGFNVHIDCWESSEIESNIMDYVSVSMQKADRIIIVNSVGAFKRYESKIEHERRLERINRGPFDELFALQIDQAFGLQQCILSIRFPYTPSSYILPPLNVLLQYVIPENINLLQTALSKFGNDTVKIDMSSTHMLKMNAAIARMSSFILAEPDWFEKTHFSVTPSVPHKQVSLPISPSNYGINGTVLLKDGNDFEVSNCTEKDVKEVTVKSSPKKAVEYGNDAYTETNFAPGDGKLDSGIHTEEEYCNSESMSSLNKSDNGKREGLMNDCGDTLIIDKNGSEYINEVKGINVFS
uniref:SEFIR domain-containing protein n=1 Tax=Syphacia muris TaxID=451379 RepID=A0A0N5AGM2_9BILA